MYVHLYYLLLFSKAYKKSDWKIKWKIWNRESISCYWLWWDVLVFRQNALLCETENFIFCPSFKGQVRTKFIQGKQKSKGVGDGNKSVFPKPYYLALMLKQKSSWWELSVVFFGWSVSTSLSPVTNQTKNKRDTGRFVQTLT